MKAVIIGATSGIGRELAKQMSKEGYVVGITGRRSSHLDSLEQKLPSPCVKATMDLHNIEQSRQAFEKLLDDMGEVDIVVINAGTGNVDLSFPLEDDLETVAVNVTGFTLIANLAFHYFARQKQGHIVGISSVAAVRGGTIAAYNASKAYISNYLEGLACRAYKRKFDIHVTDVRPGYVDTAMAQGDDLFWKAPVEKAATQIFDAIKRKRRVVYITKRWRLIAWILSILPFNWYKKVMT